MGVEIQLFECYAWKALQNLWRKDRWRIYCIYWLCKWSQYIETVQNKCTKNPTIDFNALFNPLGNSTCSSPEVVLACLLYAGSTVHNASDRFVCCVYFFFVDFAFHPSPQTKIWSLPAKFKHLYLHTHSKIGHMFIWTYLLGIVHTTTS